MGEESQLSRPQNVKHLMNKAKGVFQNTSVLNTKKPILHTGDAVHCDLEHSFRDVWLLSCFDLLSDVLLTRCYF